MDSLLLRQKHPITTSLDSRPAFRPTGDLLGKTVGIVGFGGNGRLTGEIYERELGSLMAALRALV